MGEKIYEASGRGRENFQVVHGIIAMAKFTAASNGITVSNVIGGIGYSGATSDIVGSNGIQMSFAPRFGTTAPNFQIQCLHVNSTLFAVPQLIGVASNSFAFMISLVAAASNSANLAVIGATAVTGNIVAIGYSQTGTAFS